jgi:hypothetical protein
MGEVFKLARLPPDHVPCGAVIVTPVTHEMPDPPPNYHPAPHAATWANVGACRGRRGRLLLRPCVRAVWVVVHNQARPWPRPGPAYGRFARREAPCVRPHR